MPVYFSNNPSMLKLIEAINSENENVVRSLSIVVPINKAFCVDSFNIVLFLLYPLFS